MGITATSNNTLIGEGKTVTFNASANGIGNLTYQWRKRGSDRLPDKVSGNDTLSLTIPNIEKSDEGDYYCIVTNIWNRTVESNSVTLSVYGMLVLFCYTCIFVLTVMVGLPTVTTHPNSQLITSNMSVTLDCEGTGTTIDGKPIEYQWENSNINGGNWMTIDNSNGKRLIVKNLEQSERYRCVVYNDVGGTPSNIAIITVLSKCMVYGYVKHCVYFICIFKKSLLTHKTKY